MPPVLPAAGAMLSESEPLSPHAINNDADQTSARASFVFPASSFHIADDLFSTATAAESS
jgi:hypothetical protein